MFLLVGTKLATFNKILATLFSEHLVTLNAWKLESQFTTVNNEHFDKNFEKGASDTIQGTALSFADDHFRIIM